MPRLRRVDPSRPGWARVRSGRGFRFLDEHGDPVADPAALDRLRGLAVPPAWTDVWLCPWPNGHIQAMGTDAAGRRQYRYHPDWQRRRQLEKHDRMLEFAERLPAARARVAAELATRGLTRTRVLAAAFRLLDLGFFRVGGEEYVEANHSYGLATLLREHVRVGRDTLTFDYPAKSGQHRVTSVADEDIRRVVAALERRRDPGPELLAYRSGRAWVDVRSTDINDFVKQLTGDEFTAKDFRTWSATVLAAVGLATARPAAAAPTTAKRAVAHVMREVAGYLGNTPTVCRTSYVDPRVVDLYRDGVTIVDDLDAIGESAGSAPAAGGLAFQGAVEEAVLRLLREGGRRGARRSDRAAPRPPLAAAS